AVDARGGGLALDVQVGGGGGVLIFDFELAGAAGGVGEEQAVAVGVDRGGDADAGVVHLRDDVAEAHGAHAGGVDGRADAGGVGDSEAAGGDSAAAVHVGQQRVLADPLALEVGTPHAGHGRVEGAGDAQGGGGRG